MSSKTRVLASRCRRLRLKNVREDTARRLAGMVMLASHMGAPASFQLDPVQALGIVRDVRVMIMTVMVIMEYSINKTINMIHYYYLTVYYLLVPIRLFIIIFLLFLEYYYYDLIINSPET